MASSLTWTFIEPFRSGDRSLASSSPTSSAASFVADESLAELDERALVDACLAGRTEAFDLIVERHRRSVYQLCYRFVGNHEDASDLSQDVFLRAYRGLRSFRGHAALGTWLYRIGVNVCLNRVNVKAPPQEPIDTREHEDTGAESASERLLRGERAARVRAAIAQLPRKQRATLVLRMYQEMSHQEIADVLGSSVGAVKANFFHALGNLKKLLGDGGI
ncbi:MAG TPA: sigma-70 family RNA polymerase sigma factor [Vicinamibacterales bacterium]|nr:sigma-70 family RNA polymerase sigma factor [Vicinamibacterales bacterium]